MLIIVGIYLAIIFVIGGRRRAPLRILSMAWLVAVGPIIAGVVSYSFFPVDDLGYPFVLIGFLSCFVLGVFISDINGPVAREVDFSPAAIDREFTRTRPVARFCWWIAIAGTTFVCIDFFALRGAGLDDVAALRDTYIGRSEASLPARLGSVMTWACLYCFGFGLTYRRQLRGFGMFVYLVPIAGFFLVSLFSAGRQAAFQIMVFTLLILWFNRVRYGRRIRSPTRGGAIFAIAISALMIVYMGFIAVARNDAKISDDKAEVLARIFDFRINPAFDAFLSWMGGDIRSTVTEAIVYFSSSVALFAKFLGIDNSERFFGAMSFPIIFRQIESLTGISVSGAYALKVDLMSSAGVIGVAWETAIASYVRDFGFLGACILLLVQGYYTASVWRRAIGGTGFNEGMIAVVMLSAVVYMPLLAASSDTNLLFLWVFCVLARQAGNLRLKSGGDRPAAAAARADRLPT